MDRSLRIRLPSTAVIAVGVCAALVGLNFDARAADGSLAGRSGSPAAEAEDPVWVADGDVPIPLPDNTSTTAEVLRSSNLQYPPRRFPSYYQSRTQAEARATVSTRTAEREQLAVWMEEYLTRQNQPSDETAQGRGGASHGGTNNDGGGNGLNPAEVRRGQGFFADSCTQCHDAERATSKRKSYSAWLGTVRRMAAKDDADIPARQFTAIATYLTSLNPAASGGDMNGSGGDVAAPPFTLNGTLSPVWRGTDDELENKGFFPDVWVGVEWRPENSPVSGSVVACTSCHGFNQGLGVELVEAAATLDLFHLITGCPSDKRCSPLEAHLKAGRFIVPFGAFSGRVHPGALRTVSLPLMYNMGRRVGPMFPVLQPVLPLPYSDEGIDLHLNRRIGCDWNLTFDTYAVNGLKSGGPFEFESSRGYRDNNSNLAVGGRATFGNKRIRLGGSVVSGELQDEGGKLQPYKLAGGDATFRYEDFLRVYYEYAIRVEESSPFAASRNLAYGNLVEMEVKLLEAHNLFLLARYDTLEHRGTLGEMSTERITSGINLVLRGGSLLIVNHEHWIFDDITRVNIMGVRWTVAF